MDEFGLHIQVVVTDNQPGAEKTQQGVAGKCQWLVNDLGAQRDLLKAGLGWGHLPPHLVADDMAGGQLVEPEPRAWNILPLTFMVSQRWGYDPSPCTSDRPNDAYGNSVSVSLYLGSRLILIT